MIFILIAAITVAAMLCIILWGALDNDGFTAFVGVVAAAVVGGLILAVFTAVAASSTEESNWSKTSTAQIGSFSQYAGDSLNTGTDTFVKFRTTYGPKETAQIVIRDHGQWVTKTVDASLVVINYGDTPSAKVKRYRSVHPLLAPFDLNSFPKLYVITIPKTANAVQFTHSGNATN